MFDFPAPECPSCGVLIADRVRHQQLHDALGWVWQKVYGTSDEEYEQVTGRSVNERDESLEAVMQERNAEPCDEPG